MATNDKIAMVSFMIGVCVCSLKDDPFVSSHDTNETRSPDCVSQVHVARLFQLGYRRTKTRLSVGNWQHHNFLPSLYFSVIAQSSLLSQTRTMPQKPFEIVSPVAAARSDDGQPTNSLLLDAERVFHLIQDERHLTAEDLINSVQERLDEATRAAAARLKAKGRTSVFPSANKAARSAKNARERAEHEIARVRELLETKAATIDKLKVRPLRV
jgi:hypothetical protein